jgi:DNA recombination-dependent growth factor C
MVKHQLLQKTQWTDYIEHILSSTIVLKRIIFINVIDQEEEWIKGIFPVVHVIH